MNTNKVIQRTLLLLLSSFFFSCSLWQTKCDGGEISMGGKNAQNGDVFLVFLPLRKTKTKSAHKQWLRPVPAPTFRLARIENATDVTASKSIFCCYCSDIFTTWLMWLSTLAVVVERTGTALHIFIIFVLFCFVCWGVLCFW